MNFFEQVGRNILQLLNENGKTQVWLATQLDVSRQMLQKIIKGKKAINAMEITQIAQILKVSVDQLTKQHDEVEDAVIQFMGQIENETIRSEFELINRVINEIILMEDDLDELQSHE